MLRPACGSRLGSWGGASGCSPGCRVYRQDMEVLALPWCPVRPTLSCVSVTAREVISAQVLTLSPFLLPE